ncbi:hypothetical protein ACFL20_13505, partial [Spirochaetota bacterium]
EHAGIFISRLMSKYKEPVSLRIIDNKAELKSTEKISGSFDIYRYSTSRKISSIRTYQKIGRVKISNNTVQLKEIKFTINPGDFILKSYTLKSQFLENFYYGRKKEIVLSKPNLMDSFYIFLFSIPASASMPVAAPMLGYYQNNDWGGLALWAVNATPYLYLEINGLVNNKWDLKEKKKDISRELMAQNVFAFYMLFTGGLSLFVDAFSYRFLNNASNYKGIQPLMGNSISAGYLALISGGGGHFYRGHRYWGYLYFHVNNLLIYFTIREFVKGEKYNESTASYSKVGKTNEKAAYSLVAVLGIVKIVEIIHAVLIKDKIQNGKDMEEEFSVEPLVYFTENVDLNVGLKLSYRF